MDTQALVIAITAVVGSGGAAWAGVRASLNGTRERIQRIEKQQDNLSFKVDGISRSLARLEVRAELGTEVQP